MRKAQKTMWSTIIPAVVILLTAIILLMFLRKGAEAATPAGSKEQCVESVKAQALASTINPASVIRLQCTTRYQQIDDPDPQNQKKAIAQEMASCWEQYGEGKIKLFDTETGTYCIVCSRLAFTKPQKLDHFVLYLMDSAAMFKGKSYYNYLFNLEGTPALVNSYRMSQIADQDTIDTSKPLAVMYLARKNVDNWADYTATAVVGAGVAVGTVLTLSGVGAPLGVPVLVIAGIAGGGGAAATHMVAGPYLTDQTYAAATVLWPYDEIDQFKCNRLEGKSGPVGFVH